MDASHRVGREVWAELWAELGADRSEHEVL